MNEAEASAPGEVEAAAAEGAEGAAAPEGEPAEAAPPPAEAGPGREVTDEAAELQSLLGPDVRTPVGIPKDYRPLDASLHDIFHVELEDFAGPMDLLLYLIRKHELDVFDIPIRFIADQYMQMLDALKALEIDVAAEFLVLAADLVHIKSKMLLPAKEGEAVEEDDEPEIDPREELVRRLLEYQKYRDAAEQLGDRDQLGRDVFARVPPDADAVNDLDPGLKSISIFKLVEVMARMMRRTPKISHEIELETFSIVERIRHVMGFGENRDGRFMLVDLMDSIRTRSELVVTFIAVLESTKLGLAKIMVDEEHPLTPAMLEPAAEDLPEEPQEELPEDVEAADAPDAAEDAAPEDAAGQVTEADGALEETRRLAKELEALEASMEAEAEEDRAREQARQAAAEARADGQPWVDEPLPTIWVVLTGKAFEGDILDDYQ